MYDLIEKVLAEEIRPMLEHDGGGIELVEVDETLGQVRVRLRGACHSCPFAAITLKTRVEAILKERVPGVVSVIAAE